AIEAAAFELDVPVGSVHRGVAPPFFLETPRPGGDADGAGDLERGLLAGRRQRAERAAAAAAVGGRRAGRDLGRDRASARAGRRASRGAGRGSGGGGGERGRRGGRSGRWPETAAGAPTRPSPRRARSLASAVASRSGETSAGPKSVSWPGRGRSGCAVRAKA